MKEITDGLKYCTKQADKILNIVKEIWTKSDSRACRRGGIYSVRDGFGTALALGIALLTAYAYRKQGGNSEIPVIISG
jgi:hypothetical protein